MESPGKNMKLTWKKTSKTSVIECTQEGTAPSRCGGPVSPKRTVASGLWACRTLEDKIVQSAVAEMLSAIYEVDFLGFSYGFRPGRNPHQALNALRTAIMSRYVNWVLDADIRRFFDSVNHEWLLRMVAHRIADPGYSD
jgi:retron-type reverse transcriptase